MTETKSIQFALAAAALFGASTPLAKTLLGQVSPWLLAGLLYLGSGVGLIVIRALRDRGWQPSGMAAGEWPWLIGATLFGGLLGPLALMYGLLHTPSSAASLLLNLEAVLTAVLAWVFFREHADPRIVLGMLAIVAGGVLLSWESGDGEKATWVGPLAIAAACLCWGIDNNLTRRVSASDAIFIALIKGLVAGGVNTGLALMVGASIPGIVTTATAMLVGLFGYGLSLILFVLALRGLGTSRTGAYFSTAPFIGAAIAIIFLGDHPSPFFWTAALLMGIGVWLHLTERHEHEHSHDPITHYHRHVHDAHHQHEHDSEEGSEPHAHWHTHQWLRHTHPHFPDIHHRHRH
ncbi:MAG TPA: EamA family transporter [Accumulibacter sp.]|nr:EamA family transporter [Accumulibacter sp.]HMW17134.1 EamA family transporter [Accumulibacter sp.]HMX22385.1 EamA family transporter [Accumulibacter sp.]HMY05833.1 EamA family transporter [Accumulibacter sp.]HNC17435.1 EamA family transporter [Accumulibacter sp.]